MVMIIPYQALSFTFHSVAIAAAAGAAAAGAAIAFLLPFWALSFEMITFQPLISITFDQPRLTCLILKNVDSAKLNVPHVESTQHSSTVNALYF